MRRGRDTRTPMSRLKTLNTAAGETMPSKGQPNAAEIVTAVRTPAAWAASAIANH
jgi:hypothetical protein